MESLGRRSFVQPIHLIDEVQSVLLRDAGNARGILEIQDRVLTTAEDRALIDGRK
jgi:hypothetical protein